MKTQISEKILVKFAEFNLRKAANESCIYCFHQPKVSDEMKTKLQRFKKK